MPLMEQNNQIQPNQNQPNQIGPNLVLPIQTTRESQICRPSEDGRLAVSAEALRSVRTQVGDDGLAAFHVLVRQIDTRNRSNHTRIELEVTPSGVRIVDPTGSAGPLPLAQLAEATRGRSWVMDFQAHGSVNSAAIGTWRSISWNDGADGANGQRELGVPRAPLILPPPNRNPDRPRGAHYSCQPRHSSCRTA